MKYCRVLNLLTPKTEASVFLPSLNVERGNVRERTRGESSKKIEKIVLIN